jgi:hypothetical protein
MNALRAELDEQDGQEITAESFLTALQKYTRVKKLTQYMLNELINRIEVYHAEKVDGVWRQRLRIVYNGLGTVEIPEQAQIPDVDVNTRKGVLVSYEPITAVA